MANPDEAIFSSRRQSVQQPIRWFMTVVLIGVGSYILAHIFSTWATTSPDMPTEIATTTRLTFSKAESDPRGSHAMAQRYAEDILASRLFHHEAETIDRPESMLLAGKASITKPLNVSDKLALIGVVLDADGTHRAVLEFVPTRTQAMYQTHEQVPEIGELAIIEKDRVLFRRGFQEEWLYHVLLQKSPRSQTPADSPIRPTPDRRVLDRRHVAQVGSSLESYLKEATFHPHLSRNGDIQGFRLDDIRRVGVVDLAGFQEDDILVGVNGLEMRDPIKLWNLFQQLPHEDVVHFNVMRQGEPKTLTVEIRG